MTKKKIKNKDPKENQITLKIPNANIATISLCIDGDATITRNDHFLSLRFTSIRISLIYKPMTIKLN